jgi:hypothetical protein
MPRGSTTSTYRRTNYRRTKPSLTPPEEFLENPQRITATLVRMLEVGERDEHNFMLDELSDSRLIAEGSERKERLEARDVRLPISQRPGDKSRPRISRQLVGASFYDRPGDCPPLAASQRRLPATLEWSSTCGARLELDTSNHCSKGELACNRGRVSLNLG